MLGPYPMLTETGEQGSGKSTLGDCVRSGEEARGKVV
jgi:ABC-type oligopeptide transport system ATPase subunit